MTTLHDKLLLAIAKSQEVPPQLKETVGAQSIGETGRAEREIAIKALNFWGLKYSESIAAQLGVGKYRASDGYDYCKMNSVEHAVSVYWRRLHISGYYPSVDTFSDSGSNFIHYIGPIFCPPGYTIGWITTMGMNYGDYILGFIPEVRKKFLSMGYSFPVGSATPPPVEPPAPVISDYKVNALGIIDGAIQRPVKNFDRFNEKKYAVMIHFAAALGEGIIDPWNVWIAQKSAHVLLMRDVRAFQCVPLIYRAWAAGYTWNRKAVHFELENLGPFVEHENKVNSWYDPKTDRFYRRFWPNIIQSAPRSEFIWLRHPKESRFMWWHTYPLQQIMKLKEMLPGVMEFCAGSGTPILGHDNVEQQKVDPGPAFPWELIR
jgi:N-acetyl-anhydromuramyl-L-alanine amidase AmpD